MGLGNKVKLVIKAIKYLKEFGMRATFLKTVSRLYFKYVVPVTTGEEVRTVAGGFSCIYQDNYVDDNNTNDVKTLAFYLPQFHTFPENDEWWGKGFTEWTNTRKSIPRYWRHYQPREPHEDIGYYDLSDVKILEKQARLAKEHGLYGFCIYYYWFSGKTLMEKPLELLLSHPEIDINFCLCWANESWTRTWDGQKENILIEQKYNDEDAALFIRDIKKYVIDGRYIRHKGKPVIIVYNPGDIPDVRSVFECWHNEAVKCGIGEISIWICQSFSNDIETLELDDLVDKEIEFPPHNFDKLPINKSDQSMLVDQANVADYCRMVDCLLAKGDLLETNLKLCRTVMLGWDNSSRRDSGFNVFDNFDIGQYYRWLRARVDETIKNRSKDDRYLFINAWNEWAEGTYLEPDKRYGYAYLNVTSEAISRQEFRLETVVRNSAEDTPVRIAIQVHVFYEDLIDDIIRYMNNVPEPFDCYITTDNARKSAVIVDALRGGCCAQKAVVTVYENKGRDVAPFLMQLKGIAAKYDYICHVHSKRSMHDVFGEKWRTYLFGNLLGTSKGIEDILNAFDSDRKLGLVYPNTFRHVVSAIEWGADKEFVHELMRKLNVFTELEGDPVFPAGDMLWFRSQAVHQLFEHNITWQDFPEECGQLDGTMMHAVERAWVYIARANGYGYRHINISPVKE